MSRDIVLASNNPGKLRELQALLRDLDCRILSQSRFHVPAAEETGLSFVENAILKARQAAALTGLPAIADDSGLQVDVLGGRPGIYSARYAGSGASDQDNLDRLIKEIIASGEAHATARFQCCAVYLRRADDPMPLVARGTWCGVIQTQPQGSNGFGYDPVFFVPTHGCTAAQLPADTKNEISHRGQALRQLQEMLSTG